MVLLFSYNTPSSSMFFYVSFKAFIIIVISNSYICFPLLSTPLSVSLDILKLCFITIKPFPLSQHCFTIFLSSFHRGFFVQRPLHTLFISPFSLFMFTCPYFPFCSFPQFFPCTMLVCEQKPHWL